jgi:hypothetical protein
MKTFSLISYTVFAAVAQLKADGLPRDDVIVVIWRKQTNMMGNEKKLAGRFAQLMEVIGKETEAYSKERLAALKPEKFEDRIRLIALAHVQHPDLFEEIFTTYVKYPSQEEFEKRRAAFMQSYTGNGTMSEDEVKKVKEEAAKLNREHAPPPLNLSPPRKINSKHLEAQYRFCFEYYWMAPHFGLSYRHYEGAMERALDQFKEKAGGVDMRALIEEKMKTFDPRKDPNFKLMDE